MGGYALNIEYQSGNVQFEGEVWEWDRLNVRVVRRSELYGNVNLYYVDIGHLGHSDDSDFYLSRTIDFESIKLPAVNR